MGEPEPPVTVTLIAPSYANRTLTLKPLKLDRLDVIMAGFTIIL
jgi:hypothetical protein